MIEGAIYGYLSTQALLTAEVGGSVSPRIYPDTAPSTAVLPYIVFQEVAGGIDVEHMGAGAGLGEAELRPSGNDDFAEIEEGLQQVLEVHDFRPAAVQRYEIAAEGGLQAGETIKLVQHHIAHRIALQFDDDAHTVTI